MNTKRSKACDIPAKVKNRVWERDGHRCIICGSTNAFPNAHYISRANGGLGIEENIVTLCGGFGMNCHYRYDFGTQEQRDEIRELIRKYLSSKYENWNEERLRYNR